MYALDFQYDGKYLSDFGYIICDFDSADGAQYVDAGSKITFNKSAHSLGKKYSLTSIKYDECFTATFDICKNPDLYDPSEMEITQNEYKEFYRWLNRKEFHKFCFRNDDGEDLFFSCYYNASFNIELIEIASRIFGLRLTMETDAPFGYGDEKTVLMKFASSSSKNSFDDTSDEEGFIYPDVKITCKQTGDLEISNSMFVGERTVIKGCTNGEVINIDGFTHAITTSLSSHKILNDFNYSFPKIGNTYLDNVNTFSVTRPCDIELKYLPVVKETI